MIDPRSPCIIGIARKTWRTTPAPEPLSMWAAMARQAVDDSRASSILSSIDAVHLVHCMSWAYDDAPRRLADSLPSTRGSQRRPYSLGLRASGW